MITLGDWAPDLHVLRNPGLVRAQNVVSFADYYAPMRDLVPSGDALPAVCLGATGVVAGNGSAVQFAGTASNLYRRNANGSWSVVSKAGGYTTAAGERWRFVRFQNLLIATNYSDPIQVFDLATSVLFEDLAASAPRARFLAVSSNGFLVAANVDTTNYRVQWSPFNNPRADWTDINLSADFKDLPAAGPITGLVGGDTILVLSRETVHRGYYSGPPEIFTIDDTQQSVGCAAPGSVATNESHTVFLHEEGFHLVHNDTGQVQPIGHNLIDRFFRKDANPERFDFMWAVMDPIEPLYSLAYVRAGNDTNFPNGMIVGNVVTGRFCHIIGINTEMLGCVVTPATLLDDLDAVYPDIDTTPYLIDSREFVGGIAFCVGATLDHKLGQFSGDTLAAVIETSERQLAEQLLGEDQRYPNHPGLTTIVRGVRPLCDAPTVTAQVGFRDHQRDAVQYSAASTPDERSGLCPFRINARYLRATVNIPAGIDWTQIVGLDLDASPGGVA